MPRIRVFALRIEDVGEIPWGVAASVGTLSNFNERAFESVEASQFSVGGNIKMNILT